MEPYRPSRLCIVLIALQESLLKMRRFEVRAHKVTGSDRSSPQLCAAEVRSGKNGVFKNRSREVGSIQVGASEIGIDHDGILKSSPCQVCPSKGRAAQIGAAEICPGETGIPEVRVVKFPPRNV